MSACVLTSAIRAHAQHATPDSAAALKALLDRFAEHTHGVVRAAEPDEEAYLKQLAKAVASLKWPLPPSDQPAAFPARGKGIGIKTQYPHRPLVAYELDFAPRGFIPLHDHRDFNAVLFVQEGEVHVNSYERAGRPRDDGTFDIRHTAHRKLKPGDIATLSRKRDNIHKVRAGSGGARAIDVFTYFSDEGSSHYLDVVETLAERKQYYRVRSR